MTRAVVDIDITSYSNINDTFRIIFEGINDIENLIFAMTFSNGIQKIIMHVENLTQQDKEALKDIAKAYKDFQVYENGIKVGIIDYEYPLEYCSCDDNGKWWYHCPLTGNDYECIMYDKVYRQLYIKNIFGESKCVFLNKINQEVINENRQ